MGLSDKRKAKEIASGNSCAEEPTGRARFADEQTVAVRSVRIEDIATIED